MLRHPRNNLIYLGPSGIRIWAHHARQAQFGKTSGLEKPVTEKGNPRNYSSWESHEIFSGKLFFRQPKAIYLQLEALKDMPRWNDNPGQARRSRWLKIQTLIRQSHPKRISISKDTNHNRRATVTLHQNLSRKQRWMHGLCTWYFENESVTYQDAWARSESKRTLEELEDDGKKMFWEFESSERFGNLEA